MIFCSKIPLFSYPITFSSTISSVSTVIVTPLHDPRSLKQCRDITLATRMATTRTISTIQDYHPEDKPFSSYMERVELFFAANDVADAKKVPILLSLIGRKTNGLLHNLVSPSSPANKEYKDLVDVLKTHFKLKPIVIVEQFHFHRHAQAAGESISEYMPELCRLSTHCKFKDYLNVVSYTDPPTEENRRVWVRD